MAAADRRHGNTQERFMHAEEKEKGTLCWNLMNGLRGDSTRTEVGALMATTLADEATHVGTDNQGVVNRGNAILNDMDKRSKTEVKDEKGAPNLGEVSYLHKGPTIGD